MRSLREGLAAGARAQRHEFPCTRSSEAVPKPGTASSAKMPPANKPRQRMRGKIVGREASDGTRARAAAPWGAECGAKCTQVSRTSGASGSIRVRASAIRLRKQMVSSSEFEFFLPLQTNFCFLYFGGKDCSWFFSPPRNAGSHLGRTPVSRHEDAEADAGNVPSRRGPAHRAS